jgi:probable phosphomutase (TIGR03848 family)
MDRLLLLRHAVTEETGKRLSGWLPGIHLSEQGRQQAKALAERLAGLKVDALYASPLERCQETAAAVAAVKGLEVRTVPDLGEVRYGDWTGRALRDLAKLPLWRVVQGHPSAMRFPDGELPGESLYEMQTRAVAALERLRAAHPRQTVAVCSHADVIKAVAAHYLGMHLDQYQRLVVAPASLTAFGFAPLPYLLRLNGTGDDTDLEVPPQPPQPEQLTLLSETQEPAGAQP